MDIENAGEMSYTTPRHDHDAIAAAATTYGHFHVLPPAALSVLESISTLAPPKTPTKTATANPSPRRAWKSVPKLERLFQFHDAMASTGVPTWRFSINLSEEVELAAKHATKPIERYIRDRIDHHLKRVERERQGKLLFWLVIETSADGRPHFHGEIAIEDLRLNALRLALLGAAGKTAGVVKRHQVHIDGFDPKKQHGGRFGPYGWASYALKQLPRTARSLDKSGFRSGSLIICRRGMTQLARKRYERSARRS